jgi:multicomponent Na+:H+ antiporter subunit D
VSVAGLSALLPLPVAIPLAAGALAPVVARISARLALVVGVAALLASSGILLLLAPDVYGGTLLAHFMGHWIPIGNNALGIAFAADPFGLSYALCASGIGAVLLVFTLSSLRDLGARELGSFTCLFLLLDAALIASALTADTINLFVWFEVAALASYALTAFFLERPLALEAAFKILVLTNIASFLIFIAAALLYARTGALDFGQVHLALAGHPEAAELVALGLLIAGFATKAGLAPFHSWLPDAHTAAPGPVSALFSGLMVNLGVVAIARITFQVFTPRAASPVLGLLMVLGLASTLGGAVFALVQDDLKRLLGFDTISQMGLLVVGLAAGRADGLAGTTYHLIDHALFKTLLFLVAGAIVHGTGAEKLSEMGGLGRRSPLLAVAFVIGVVAIAGIPPLNGYAGVGLIHDSLSGSGQWVPYAICLIAQCVTVAALGRAAWLAFFRPGPGTYQRDEPLHPGMVVSFALLSLACVAFGVIPTVMVPHVVAPAAAGLLAAGTYAKDVLAGGGHLPSVSVSFHYFAPKEWVPALGAVVAAVPLAYYVVRRGPVAVLEKVRAVQNGSVNDYASYLVAGVVATVATLAIGH